jgi:hypothetical protein
MGNKSKVKTQNHFYPVMLSFSETSHFTKPSLKGDPSLSLRMTLLTFFQEKESKNKKKTIFREIAFLRLIRKE